MNDVGIITILFNRENCEEGRGNMVNFVMVQRWKPRPAWLCLGVIWNQQFFPVCYNWSFVLVTHNH